MKILITGGASGVGKSISEHLVKANHDILITYFRSGKTAEELKTSYGINNIYCDFGSDSSIDALKKTITQFQPDVLINNALTGIHKQYFHKQQVEDFANSFMSDVMPVLMITQAAIKVFRKKKFGKLINIISSAVVNTPPIGWSVYTANKSYLLSMSKSWAIEYRKHNITSNSISPSFMLTDLNNDMDERIVENMITAHPLKELLNPIEVAKAAEYLVNASQHVNGINLVINTGESLV